jgi:hypothetical protein
MTMKRRKLRQLECSKLISFQHSLIGRPLIALVTITFANEFRPRFCYDEEPAKHDKNHG